MHFYLDPIDADNSLLIVHRGESELSSVLGLRFDGINANSPKRVLMVVPIVEPSVSSDHSILAVFRVNTSEIEQIEVIPIFSAQAVSMHSERTIVSFDLERRRHSIASEPTRYCWAITESDQPTLSVEAIDEDMGGDSENHNDDDIVSHTYIVEKLGNSIGCGVKSGDNADKPILEIRISLPDLGELELSVGCQNSVLNEDIEVGFEHLMASADVCEILEGTDTTRHEQIFNPIFFFEESVDSTFKFPLVREDQEGNSYGVGYMDRIVIKTNIDCELQFWESNRCKIKSSEGLLILTHLGLGRFVQDRGKLRDFFHSEIKESNENREHSLFDLELEAGIRWPSSGTEHFSMPLQYACYEICKNMAEAGEEAIDLTPVRLDTFCHQPEIYYILQQEGFAQVAIFDDNVGFEDLEILESVKYLCEAVLCRDLQGEKTVQEIQEWCALITTEVVWFLLETVVSGHAKEMIECGVRFDNENPRKFIKQFKLNRENLLGSHKGEANLPSLREDDFGVTFLLLDERINAMAARPDDMELLKKVAIEISSDTGLFKNGVILAPKKEDFDSYNNVVDNENSVYIYLRSYLKDVVERCVSEWFENNDVENINPNAVSDMILHYFVKQHLEDLQFVRKALKNASIEGEFSEFVIRFLRDPKEANLTSAVKNQMESEAFDTLRSIGRTILADRIFDKIEGVVSATRASSGGI